MNNQDQGRATPTDLGFWVLVWLTMAGVGYICAHIGG